MSTVAQFVAIGVAAAVAGYTGFGFNLLAVPLLTMVIPPKEAVVLALVVGIVVQVILAAQSLRHASMKHLAQLSVGAVIGVGLGIAVFRTISGSGLDLTIACMTLLFGVSVLLPRRTHRVNPRVHSAIAVGGLSGLLAASTGMSGPPVAAYTIRTNSDPAIARATIAVFVVLAAVLAVLGLIISGSVPSSAITTALRHIPAGLIGVMIGSTAFRRRPNNHRPVTGWLLVAVGLASLATVIT